MKPIIILPPDAVSEPDIKLLRENGLCVVTAKEPAKIKFLDPIPSAIQRGKPEQAAIQLSRILLNGQWANYCTSNVIGRGDIAKMYVDMLIKGTELDRNGSTAEQEQRIFTDAKVYELQRLAREEAKVERAAKKAAAAKVEK